MVIVENWALFAEGMNLTWYFGDLDENFRNATISFLNGLNDLGGEIFGEAIATIRLDAPLATAVRASEIFVINLGRFFFILSDPSVTIKLIKASGLLPEDIDLSIRGVLAGQAAVLYANLCTVAESDKEISAIDNIFKDVLVRIGIDSGLEDIVDQGRCSFASLDIYQLLFLHYYLRLSFESRPELSKNLPWAILVTNVGDEVFLNMNIPDPTKTTILAGYLSVIHMFISELFISKPKTLVFGSDQLISLEIFNGNEVFLAASNPTKLLLDGEFHKHLATVNQSVKEDIIQPLKFYIAKEVAKRYQTNLLRISLDELFLELKSSTKQVIDYQHHLG